MIHIARSIKQGKLHICPVFIKDELHVFAITGKFTLSVRLGVNATVREHQALTDLCHFALNLHQLVLLYYIKEIGLKRH